jgi:Fe-S oxidoreductase
VFAAEPFTRWWRSRHTFRGPRATAAPRGPVLLWPDTFTNAIHPGIGRAAVEVMEDAGFEVRVPQEPVCCGLTWVSTGQLATARRVLRRTLRVLRDDIRTGVPLVGLEPSCTTMFRSDGLELLDGDEDMRRLAAQTRTLAEVLADKAPDWDPPKVNAHAMRQTHCHQHAVLGSEPDHALLARAGIDTEQLSSGCCGLAGNFGMTAAHRDVSLACAEQGLLPAVRAAAPDTLVLADGFSCRTQIDDANTGKRPRHLAEVLHAAVRGRRVP